MADYQDFKNIIKPIHSLRQLVASYYVAEAIIDIRDERKNKVKKYGKDSLPQLHCENPRSKILYEKFAELVGFSPVFVFLVKRGLETIETYKFIDDPSVITQASQDTAHLSNAFGTTFASLSRINLEEHTLNVFEEGIKIGEKKGRIMQIALPMVGCLFHDFGKSSKLRNELLGEMVGKGYKAHAEVSDMYVRELLAKDYHKVFPNNSIETIELLANIVKNHHPNDRKKKSDTMISMVIQADMMARKSELAKIKKGLIK